MKGRSPVRYAVVGLGHIAQAAVLPAFKKAAENARLAMLFSDDPVKRSALSRRYGAPALPYEAYRAALRSGAFDAVYVAVPNALHKDYAVAAAEAGVHVLCEKPLASSSLDARAMVEAARRGKVLLMTAYRLHFEHANVEAIKAVRAGRIGEPRYFNSSFSGAVKPGNVRLKGNLGGGALWDLGVYCVNAARGLFGSNPVEAVAMSHGGAGEVDESTSAVLRFPGGRLACFVCSQGAADRDFFEVVGTRGVLRMEQAYEYADDLSLRLTVDGKEVRLEAPRRDQFAAELVYFSSCVRAGREPEPSGEEGLADVRIIEALHMSAHTGRAIPLAGFLRPPSLDRPDIRRAPARRKSVLVHAEPAHA